MKRLVGSFLLCFQLTCSAQVLEPRGPVSAPEFTLGPGDQVAIHVTDLEEIPQTPMRIPPSGRLDLPLIGEFQASGLTIDQLRESLALRLSKYINSPDVTINLIESESRPVSVVGEVMNPGLHQMMGPQRLLDVLSMSGGLKTDAGAAVKITRQAQWGKLPVGPVTVDSATHTSSTTLPLDTLLALKAPEDNIVMEPEDVVSVPKAELIYVVGDVKKAGGFELTTHNTISALHALTLAEGLGPDNAAKHARILRPAPNGDGSMSQIPIDIPKILEGKAPDIQLYANDVLFVPHSGFKVGSRRAVDAAIGLTTGILIYR